jgi:hypothetical protein
MSMLRLELPQVPQQFKLGWKHRWEWEFATNDFEGWEGVCLYAVCTSLVTRVSLTPGMGSMPKLLTTSTWAWPPPSSTKSCTIWRWTLCSGERLQTRLATLEAVDLHPCLPPCVARIQCQHVESTGHCHQLKQRAQTPKLVSERQHFGTATSSGYGCPIPGRAALLASRK